MLEINEFALQMSRKTLDTATMERVSTQIANFNQSLLNNMVRIRPRSVITLIRDSFAELSKNDPLRMAGATAFFTTFALPPILIILILALGLVFNRRTISRQLFSRLETVIGSDSVDQLILTLRGFNQLSKQWWFNLALLIFLLFVATTLFKVIKGSLNQIWNIRIEQKKNIRYNLNSRFHSVIVILLAGILFLAALLADGIQAFLGKYITFLHAGIASFLGSAINQVVSTLIVTIWFSILFRYLPDGRPTWKVSFVGGFVTALLFNLGKLLIGFLLSFSNITTLYGASGSLVLLLLFVFYASLILYFGAAFTKVWSNYVQDPIKALPHAVQYQIVKIDVEEEI